MTQSKEATIQRKLRRYPHLRADQVKYWQRRVETAQKKHAKRLKTYEKKLDSLRISERKLQIAKKYLDHAIHWYEVNTEAKKYDDFKDL